MTPDSAARLAHTGTAGASPAGQRVVAVVPLRDGSSGKSRLATVLDPAERSRLIAALARHVVGTLLACEAVERVLVVTSDPRFTWRALESLADPVQPLDDAPGSPRVTDPPADGDDPAGRGRPTPPSTVTPPRAEGDHSPAEGDATGRESDGPGRESDRPGRLQIVLQPASRPGLNAALDVGRELVVDDSAHPTGSETRPVRLLVAHADLPALTVEDVESLLAQDAPVVVATDRGRSGTNLLVLDADAPFTFRFGVGSLDAHLAEADLRGLRAAVVQRTGTAVDLDTLDDWSELPADVRARDELSELYRAMGRASSDT